MNDKFELALISIKRLKTFG